jgi:hypothetical protein
LSDIAIALVTCGGTLAMAGPHHHPDKWKSSISRRSPSRDVRYSSILEKLGFREGVLALSGVAADLFARAFTAMLGWRKGCASGEACFHIGVGHGQFGRCFRFHCRRRGAELFRGRARAQNLAIGRQQAYQSPRIPASRQADKPVEPAHFAVGGGFSLFREMRGDSPDR